MQKELERNLFIFGPDEEKTGESSEEFELTTELEALDEMENTAEFELDLEEEFE